MKRLIAFFTVFLVGILSMPFLVFAADDRVYDGADLFSDQQEQQLEQLAEVLSQKYDTDVFVLTDYQSGYSSNYARDYLEAYGEANYPDGYVAYMINMQDRSYWIDAYGMDEREVFTQDVTDKLSEIAYNNLKEGNYSGSAQAVLKEIGNQFEMAGPLGWLKKPLLYPGKALMMTGIAGVAALAAAGIWTAMKLSAHKDKGVSQTAAQYGNDLNLTVNRNIFLNHYQTRVARPKQNHSSGGGFSGGGGGGGHTGSGGHF